MKLEVIPVTGLPEIARGDDLARLLLEHAEIHDGDVVVVAQKIVSKSEGRMIETDPAVSVPTYESWWEVVPAEASEQDGVRKARQDWSANKKRQRRHI